MRCRSRVVLLSQHNMALLLRVNQWPAAAGVQILERGGNAVDAAIATNAVVGLMEPMMNGIGGDLFVLYYEPKSGNVYGLNESGWSPSGLTLKFLSDQGVHQMPQAGINSVTVPGVVAGWQTLHDRFGTMPLSTLLEPAIDYADKGVPINEITLLIWNYFTKLISATEYGSYIFDQWTRAKVR